MADPAIVLLSGGLDSTTVLAIAAQRGFAPHALSFDYGQRHAVELDCARYQARRFGAVAHEVVDLGHLTPLVRRSTALVRGSELEVPKGRDLHAAGIPSTYVPARNTLFLAYALAWAEAVEAQTLFIGVNALDYSGYPDCRPEYVRAFEAMANLATRMGVEGRRVRVESPLVDLHKHEIVELGTQLGVDYARTVSCYDPQVDTTGQPLACSQCDSCRLRKQGFDRAGIPDPTLYQPG